MAYGNPPKKSLSISILLRPFYGKNKYPTFIFILLFFTVLTFLLRLPNGNNFYIIEESTKSGEINQILQETPYLWRKFIFSENETIALRIKSQREWIKKLSNTEFIQLTNKKNVLVQDGITQYYNTNGKLQCPYAPQFEDKCILIEETWKEKFTDSMKYENIDALVGRRDWEPKLFEPLIPHHVLKILYILEPPCITKKVDLGTNNALLASYFRGSDIPLPYRQWVPFSETFTSTLSKFSESSFNKINPKSSNHFYNKTKMVAAVISNCDDCNGRMSYIKELQKYIQVDVYGKCGPMSCEKSHENFKCMKMIEQNYKFYLAFENSNCFDYITEKFFVNGLQYDLVPIVLGAHPDHYRTAAPEKSFIHVDDFQSPSKLAEYLQILNQNEDLYQEYFKSKRKGHITSDALEDFFCRLCGMLHYADFVPPPQWESSITLWQDINKCLPYKQWYWHS